MVDLPTPRWSICRRSGGWLAKIHVIEAPVPTLGSNRRASVVPYLASNASCSALAMEDVDDLTPADRGSAGVAGGSTRLRWAGECNVNVELVLSPGCPNAAAARAVLAECQRRMGSGLRVQERVGDYPSPTILVNGVDVMTGAEGIPRARACRLDVPAVEKVLAALEMTSVRVRGLTPAARAVHRVILRGFATTGRAPDRVVLAAAVAGEDDLEARMRELHHHDVVRLDAGGRIRAAYPFSAVPTAHTVTIADGPAVWAMCAIDALGIAGMLGRDVTIDSVDPQSGVPVRVAVRGGEAQWDPASTVVIDGVMNFFTSTESAQAWLAAHPRVSGTVLSQEQALRLGIDAFGRLLD